MKKIIYYMLWFALSLSCWGCNDDEDTKELPVVKPEATGTVVDNEGNEYTWVRYNGLDWMTSNLKCGKPFYKVAHNGILVVRLDNKDQALAEYDSLGNLFSYEEALANAPEGWRLPSDEDWKNLEKILGMSASEANTLGWRGSVEGELIQQGANGSGICLLLSGLVSLQERTWTKWPYFTQVREYGYYWTSTIDESHTLGTTAYYRRIGYYTSQIERNVTAIQEKSTDGVIYNKYLSVRYVRDAR
ncbi:fibrobacter succinogenes major paralogous domain-containing protein [uncultured Butyricimonas sp.]|uniref:fibrobacter succinogenes major paralogous domain-containing protein n=1 Tax=uncultured Butyricimonas sp. TaxID=1268785 RepID=UPI0026DBD2FC|nr:fibrobacter succinogenes major paralogous domain-containing protein [uncultured Butyricimonas sp.]